MRDKISERRIDLLHPMARGVFKDFIEECERTKNITLRITEGLRTWEEQAKIYAQGRTTPGKIVSYAPPGKSWHNYGLAIDIALLDEGKLKWDLDYKSLENISLAHGLTWGGNFVVKGKPFPDYPHYQITFGKRINEMLTLYASGKFIEQTKYVDIA